jgi:hypothetical protein
LNFLYSFSLFYAFFKFICLNIVKMNIYILYFFHKIWQEQIYIYKILNSMYKNISTLMILIFNATFNNISVRLWRSVLLVEVTGVPGENHRPVASHWQTLSHNVDCYGISVSQIITDMFHLKEKQRSTKHIHKTKRSRNTKLTKKPEVNSGEAVRAPLVASVVLI